MPRPRKISDDDVLAATQRVLVRAGPGRLTLAEVALECGLAPATLVQRFGSKRALMLAFARAAARDAAAPFEAARRSVASPLGALRAALSSASVGVGSREEVANGLAVLLDDLGDEAMREAAAHHARATLKAIHRLLLEAQAAGEIPPGDAGGLASTVQAAWNGAIVQWALRGTGPFEAFLDAVLAPLLPPPTKRVRRPHPRRRREKGTS